jgi:hypothetical protein
MEPEQAVADWIEPLVAAPLGETDQSKRWLNSKPVAELDCHPVDVVGGVGVVAAAGLSVAAVDQTGPVLAEVPPRYPPGPGGQLVVAVAVAFLGSHAGSMKRCYSSTAHQYQSTLKWEGKGNTLVGKKRLGSLAEVAGEGEAFLLRLQTYPAADLEHPQ